MTMGWVDRFIRSSVESAVRMQPRRITRIVDENLYGAPSAREEVAAFAAAGARMVRAGLAPSTVGGIAVRRSETSATTVVPGADLAEIDNRTLSSVKIGGSDLPAVMALAAGHAAAAWGMPPALMALASVNRLPETLSADLALLAGELGRAESPDEAIEGVTVVFGRGVIATHATLLEAVTRMEAAEALADMTIKRDTVRRTDG